MACQKMANGFATTEELAGKAGVLVSHEVGCQARACRFPCGEMAVTLWGSSRQAGSAERT